MSGVASAPGTDPGEERVLLISMPFGALERPALSLGLLQAHCGSLGVSCDTRYLSFKYADRVGLGNYLWICSDDVPYTAFAGDWLFTEALYGVRPYADAAYTDEVLRRAWQLSESDIARLQQMRTHVAPFLRDCLQSIAWHDYTFVGFTSVFQQNVASLALAARVKRDHPDLTIAFGGANWEEAMGVALQEQFQFVDLAFSGEADESFPAVLAARRRGEGVQGIAGVSASSRRRLAALTTAPRVRDLDTLPVPEYDSFFGQMRTSVAAGITPTLLMETARGCWWGERSHCTFCGLNGASMAFRSKTPERVLTEIESLQSRYHTQRVSVVDDILDMRYFTSVLPLLAERVPGTEFFWEVKANLTHDQVRQLRDAGIVLIESLSDHVLKLMRKGTTGFRNIELMKWCREYGVKPYWNFLYGFPGETEADYREQASLIAAIWHLDPPTGHGPIRLDRFSPYHADAAGFGLTNVRPMAPFTYLYPFEPERLMEIAYYFDFDYGDGRAPDHHAAETLEFVRSWIAEGGRGDLQLRTDADGTVELLDTRRELALAPVRAVLEGWKAAVYLMCDRAQTLARICDLPTVQNEQVTEHEVAEFLGRCVQHRLMVTTGRRWLSVGVHVPARDGEPSMPPASSTISRSTRRDAAASKAADRLSSQVIA